MYFTCHSHGSLKHTVSWVKLDQEEGGFEELSAEGSEVLEIENITMADNGLYACVVGNKVAYAEAVAYLNVIENHVVVPVVKYDNMKFTVMVSGTLLAR